MHLARLSRSARALLWLGSLPLLVFSPGLGCGDSATSCTPGESAACTCSSGDPGAQICADDGEGFDGCECDSGGAGRSSGGAGRGVGTHSFGEGEYGIELRDPDPGTYCWYIEETDRICYGERDTSYADLCIDGGEDCVADEPAGSEEGTFECSTTVSYVTVGFGPLTGDCDKLAAYWDDDPSVECLYHRHCGPEGTCVDYQCVCPVGVLCDPSAPGGNPGTGGSAGSGSASGGGPAGSGPGGSGGSGPGGNGGAAGAPDGPPGGGGGVPGGPGGPGGGSAGVPPPPPSP